jgi:hypothetical protein
MEKGKAMYKSPIEIIYGQMQKQMEGDILKAVQSYGINVDKDELLRALQYDRNQYKKGYMDGKTDAMSELVRCKDCEHWMPGDSMMGDSVDDMQRVGGCPYVRFRRLENDFCSYGERREGE